LFEALVLSGISMKLAGTSSPASGGEHLLSHFWDMRASLEGRVEGWHGAQVGVATLVTAALYEELSLLEPEAIEIDRLLRSRAFLEEQMAAARARWPEHGEEVAREVEAGYLPDPSQTELLRRLKGSWKEMWASLGDVLRPAPAIAGILRAAGAPTTMAELGLERSHLLAAYRHAREIRRRYTVLDLAFDLDMLGPLEPRVFSRSAVLCKPTSC
jgi:glycerol-1-phosphate dehydrogenase [NAD(P)+]